jgi:hypothetical protein
MYQIQYSSTGLGCDWEPLPDSQPRPTAEEAKEDARIAWAQTGVIRDWVRVIREGARRPVFVFMGGRFRVNMNKWQRVPARRIGDV